MAALFRPLLAVATSILLVFSQLIIFLNAVPVTRSLMYGRPQVHQFSENSNLQVRSGDEMNDIGRMAVEINDYPGSGANNRHIPRPQLIGRGCVDC